jgi:RNA polymerase sigma-70 factor (ECF subfamily)
MNTIAQATAELARTHPEEAATVPSAQELCDRYADRVHHFAAMVARDAIEADDLAQAALERAIRALPRFDPGRGELSAWLWRIVVNVARDAGRAARRRHLLLQRLASLRETAPPDDAIPAGISDERLLAAVRRLTDLQRSVIALRFGADLEFAAVGAALGMSTGAARVATHRALSKLRASLEDK